MDPRDMKEFQKYLKGTAPFLPDADCAFFRPHLRKAVLARKAFFLKRAQVCRSLGFVLSGAFRVFYGSGDKEVNTHFILPHGFVAEYGSFLKQSPSLYSIQALEASEAITFDFASLRKAYDHSHAWERFGRLIAETAYRRTRERTESFLFLDGEGRYLQALKQEPELFPKAPLYPIASYLGLERETLIRVRRRLVRGKRGM